MGYILTEPCKPMHVLQSSQQAEDWRAANLVLLKGEMGIEVDTGRFKVGDGIHKWNQLPYAADPVGSTPAVDAKLTAHIADTVKHTTQDEKDEWNSKAKGNHNHDTTYDPLGVAAVVEGKLESHRANAIAHTTQAEKDAWNGKAEGEHNHDGRYDPLGAAANKMDRVPGAVDGNLAVFDEAGNVRDCGAAPISMAGILERIAAVEADLAGKASKAPLQWYPLPLLDEYKSQGSEAQFARDEKGLVYLRGGVIRKDDTGVSPNTTFAELPVGFLPENYCLIPVSGSKTIAGVSGSDGVVLWIAANGALKVRKSHLTTFDGASLSLDGVVFQAML